MDLADRLVAIGDWTIAKKTSVFALGFGLPVQIVQVATARLAMTQSTALDLRWFDALAILFVAHMALVGGVSAVVAARGHEGRWTAYAMYLPFAVLMGVLMYAFGLALAPSWMPLILAAFLSTVWYQDVKIGLVTVVLAGLVGVSVAALTAIGTLPHAPAFNERSLDVLATPAMLLAGAAVLSPLVFSSFVVIVTVTVVLRRERDRLAAARDQLDKAFGLVSRYVPEEVASEILAGPDSAAEGYRRQKVTVFFSDIVGFTDLTEELEPEDLAVVLNEYFSAMTEIAHEFRGTVDELQGDGLIIVFGAPAHTSDRDHALDAVRMAVAMRESVARLNERWQDAGIAEPVAVRMGINTGVVTVGHFGSGGRMKYTVLGKHVNLAARIQAVCEPGNVLISHATWLLVRDSVDAQSLGEREFKGIVRPVEVHELVR